MKEERLQEGSDAAQQTASRACQTNRLPLGPKPAGDTLEHRRLQLFTLIVSMCRILTT